MRDRQEYEGTYRVETFKLDRLRTASRFIYLANNFEIVTEFLVDYIYRLRQLSEEDLKKALPIAISLDKIQFQNVQQSFVSDVYEQYLFSKKIYKNEYYYTILYIIIIFKKYMNLLLKQLQLQLQELIKRQ